MLQIVTRNFFRPVELRENLHRATLYTNYRSFRDRAIDLPVGRLVFSTMSSALGTLSAEIWERLERFRLDGTEDDMISTGGDQLIEEVAAVTSFVLNITCTTDPDLTRRLISASHPGLGGGLPNQLLKRTFDAHVYAKDEEAEILREFMSRLTSLDRKNYEAIMRAIRRCVTATHRVADDVSLAYTLFVAALESLAHAFEPKVAQWSDYDEVKRRRIDSALANAEPERAEAVRAAILQNGHVALRRRFIDFVLEHVRPAFYRGEAVGITRPIRSADLPKALDRAYAIRSRNVHQLEDLAGEVRIGHDHSDTALFEDSIVLTAEGLRRLSRHVIGEYLRRATPVETEDFNYRSALPGIIHMRLAPEYWIWQSEGFTAEAAPGRFEGFLEHALPALRKIDGAAMTDLRPLLGRIEELAPGAAKHLRLPMLGIYYLWHQWLSSEHHRPKATKFIQTYLPELSEPSVVALLLHLLTREPPEWNTDQLLAIERDYWTQRGRKRGQRVPAPFEAAMSIFIADRLGKDGRSEEATAATARAVEAMPGTGNLIAMEEQVVAGEPLPSNAVEQVLGIPLDEKEPTAVT